MAGEAEFYGGRGKLSSTYCYFQNHFLITSERPSNLKKSWSVIILLHNLRNARLMDDII